MIKLFTILFFMSLLLDARENPFFPAEGETDMPVSSNISAEQNPLKRATLTLPATARSLESFSVTYKNLDGSIEKKSVQLNNSIDWHLPLFLSQNYAASDSKTPIKKLSKEPFKKIASLKFIALYSNKKELKVITEDEMIRNFILVKPHRIVCDFKRELDIRSYVKKMPKQSIVKEFRVGNHKGYYRLVIELDGNYKYSVEKITKGYIFKLL